MDDLNDWVGCLDGHPLAHTPNIDRLAARGVLFANAHCQSPVCNPSRASMLTGLYPETTGIYFLSPEFTESAAAQRTVTLPARFESEGYTVSGAGKVFHGGQNAKFVPNYAGGMGGFGPRPEEKLSPYPGHPLWDWGEYPERNDQMPDVRIADWCAQVLTEEQEGPRLTAIGFYRPHVPQYASREWFELHPAETLRLPAVASGDLEDISGYAHALTRTNHVAPTHEWVIEHGQWGPLVRSYLACVSFVDAQVGRVLDALDAGPGRDSTFVVLYSDHGFHLGEKERWAKRSLWEDSTRVPLIIAGPGIEGGVVCHRPVELIDIYPTLLALVGVDADAAHEGQSLVPLLRDPEAPWPHVARTSFGPGNVAIRSEHHRYIVYADGSEELYDHRTDPHEWINRIGDPAYAETAAEHRAQLPGAFHEVLGEGSTGHAAFNAAEATGRE